MQRRWVGSPDYRAIVDVLRRTRIAKDLSQREVARRLGKHVSFLNKIELIERRIDVLEFLMLCRALEVDPHEILNTMAGAISDTPEF